MTIKTSTGLRNAMLASAPFRVAMNLGNMKIYAGVAPGDADAAIPVGTVLLCTITNNATGTGLTFEADASAGVIVKTASEIWKGVNLATGAAAFYRLVGASDNAASSTTQPRVQGTVATAGADLNLSSVSLTAGANQTIDFFSMALPTT